MQKYSTLGNFQSTTFVEVKKLVYKNCVQIAGQARETRVLAYYTILWLEYLALAQIDFKPLQFCSENLELFAALLLDVALECTGQVLRARCSTEYMVQYAVGMGFSVDKVWHLHETIKSLDLNNVVRIQTLLKYMDELLQAIPQPNQVHNVALKLLDNFNVHFFSIKEDKMKVAASCVAVARVLVLKSENEKWPDGYLARTGIAFEAFEDMYDQMCSFAHQV